MAVKPKRSVIRISEDGQSTWYHASPTGDELVLRKIPVPAKEQLGEERRFPAAEVNGDQFLIRKTAEMTGLPVSGFSIDEAEAWTLVVRRLDRIGTKERQIVPVTPLRRLYQGLRDLGGVFRTELAAEVHLGMAMRFAEASDLLAKLCNRSLKKFERYDPGKLPYLDERRDQLPATDKPPFDSTTTLVAAIQAMGNSIPVEDAPELSFRYVERELSPLRTQNAFLETGEPASSSGSGGADLLLQNSQDGVPIIGEIKIRTDTTLLLALIQAMTYALEFSTPKQIRRLATPYSEFEDLAASGGVDVYLISAEPPQTEPYPSITHYVQEIAERICGEIAFLRRIAYIEAVLDEEGAIRFQKEFVFE